MKRGMRALLAAAFGAALIFACGMHSATAADDDETEKEETFEEKLLKNIMRGLGADVGDAKIDYHERSPLVVPPNRDLPLPQNAKAVENNPAWPRDPDRKSRKKEAAVNPWANNDPDRALRPDELERGRKAGAGRVTTPSSTGNDSEIGRTLKPSELGYRGGLWDSLFNPKKEESEPFRGEPPRTSLTAPPSGYQTPSPSYPYGISPEKKTPLPSVTDRAVGAQ
ncbi:MAG: hypothetical protein HY659_08505 [Rhizobiales bacterium]|nr:hypothetical protein [Hyphomicrobiales bacterium]